MSPSNRPRLVDQSLNLIDQIMLIILIKYEGNNLEGTIIILCMSKNNTTKKSHKHIASSDFYNI